MKPDGSDIKTYKAPRLAGRRIVWDSSGQGVYYQGQDIEKVPSDNTGKTPPGKDEKSEKDEKAKAPHAKTSSDIRHVGVNALWRLDLATGRKRISPNNLHVTDFRFSDEKKMFSGVLKRLFPKFFF
jgi:hypothetical protein